MGRRGKGEGRKRSIEGKVGRTVLARDGREKRGRECKVTETDRKGEKGR